MRFREQRVGCADGDAIVRDLIEGVGSNCHDCATAFLPRLRSHCEDMRNVRRRTARTWVLFDYAARRRGRCDACHRGSPYLCRPELTLEASCCRSSGERARPPKSAGPGGPHDRLAAEQTGNGDNADVGDNGNGDNADVADNAAGAVGRDARGESAGAPSSHQAHSRLGHVDIALSRACFEGVGAGGGDAVG